jgi:hypothetical protein
VFTLGRTELYSMHAFDIKGPIATTFVAFRPTALSRVQAFDANGDGWVRDDERKAMKAAMAASPTVIGPELEAKDVRVWLNGTEERITRCRRRRLAGREGAGPPGERLGGRRALGSRPPQDTCEGSRLSSARSPSEPHEHGRGHVDVVLELLAHEVVGDC